MARDTAPSCSRLHELIARQAARRPQAVALWWREEPLNYLTLNDNLLALANRLAGTGERGDRVAVLAWNCPEFIEMLYGVPAAGKILVPLNARLAPQEWIFQLQSSGATTLFGDPLLLATLVDHPDFPPQVQVITLDDSYPAWRNTGVGNALPPTSTEGAAWILYTSGSTGRPKGAILSHRSLLAGLRSAALGRPVDPEDKYYYPFPLFHVAAHNVLLQHQYGAAVVLAPSFTAEDTLKACRELGVTTLSLAPTMIAMLLNHPDFQPADLRTVRTIGYGASAMPVTLLQQLLGETSVGLCQSYGMTELSGSVSFLTVADHQQAAHNQPELLHSVGKPLPTAQLKLVDDNGQECQRDSCGEILVKAAQSMEGYWDDREATDRTLVANWLHTGDIGRFDADGYLFIVDRKKDMIISGGENIASREVEEALRHHHAVSDCAVIGLPDARWGESVCAVVCLRSTASDEALADHCRAQLAGYKTPRRFIRVDSLPLNAAGKIDKPRLRELYSRDVT